MGDNEELSVDQETVDQKVDQPGIGDEPQPQNSTDDFDPKKHTRVQTGANGELCFQGLTQAEVEARIVDGQVNVIQDSSNRSVKDIVMGNTLTFFNFINIVLLALVLSVRSYKNMLFIFIIIANTLIGIFQEIKAKITLDKLKILTVSHVDVIRDGVKKSITVSELVKDDVILLKSGGQIPADGVILDGEVDVNESLLTGESDSIHKTCGSKVLSGSFVTSGKAMCLLTEVGHDCYMEKLSSEAKQFKRYKTELQRNLDTILKFISIIIVPLGIILFAKQYWISGSTYEQAALDTVAAVLGMIPEGLVLLTSVALALGAVRLARRSTLVRELFCIETLARVDTLCLDKTGTITEGHLCVQGEESVKEDVDLEQLMGRMVAALGDENETFQALRQHYKRNQSTNTKLVLPFSSERKFSGVVFEGEGTYLMGAYQFIFLQADPAVLEKIAEYASQGLRVLTIAHSPNEMTDYTLAEDFEIVGFVFMTDVVRKNAPDILGYFEEQGVDLKVISGDDPVTVAAIAARAGLKDADKYIDATTIHTDEEMEDAILKYSVFGRVTPKQKQQMVRLLKQNGRTVAMTGDGVNDVLALKDADVSIIVGQNYPFQPIQLSVINGCAVAIPTMLLQLEPSFQKVNKHFFREVLRMSMPAAITITAMITIINNIGHSIGTPREMLSTVCVLATGWVYLITLRQVYSPMTGYRKFVIYLMQTAYLVAMVIGQRIMELVGLNFTCVIVTLAAVNFAPMIIDLATKGYDKFFYWYDHRHDVKPPKPIKVKTRRFRGV